MTHRKIANPGLLATLRAAQAALRAAQDAQAQAETDIREAAGLQRGQPYNFGTDAEPVVRLVRFIGRVELAQLPDGTIEATVYCRCAKATKSGTPHATATEFHAARIR